MSRLETDGSTVVEPAGEPQTDLLLSEPAFAARIRRVGIAACSGLVVASAASGRPLWSTLGLGGLLAVLVAFDLRGRRAVRSAKAQPWTVIVGAILTVVSCVILLTGGVDSVLLIIAVPIGFTLGFSTPDPRVSTLPAALIAVLAGATTLWMPEGHRWSWSLSAELQAGEHPALATLLVALFSLLCARLGRDARKNLSRARSAAERAQAERLAVVAERNAGLVGLMGAVAHELKNPLTTVQSLTSHMHRKAPEDSPVRTPLGVVRGEVSRMRATVDRLLNTARPIGHSLAPDGLHLLAREVVQSHRALAEGQHITLTAAAGEATALFDRRKLLQVVGNLVLNAIEACEGGGRVTVAVGQDGEGPWLEVIDDGPGIPEGIRDVLGRPGVTTKSGGSGIGLALSRSIVEQHGGRLSLLDGHGGGCRARISLPAMDAHETGAPR